MISSQSIAPLLIGEGAFFVEPFLITVCLNSFATLSRIKRENMGNLLFQVTRVCHRPGEFWIFLDLRNLPNISSAQITGSSGCKLSEIIYVHIL